MTTIAYKKGVLAADTLWSAESVSDDYGPKIWRQGRILVGAVGCRSTGLKFRDWIRSGLKGEHPYHGEPVGNGMLVLPDHQLVCWSSRGPWRITRAPFYAIGSGEQFALAAMEMGASAEQAVLVAMKFDLHTGGEVNALRLV